MYSYTALVPPAIGETTVLRFALSAYGLLLALAVSSGSCRGLISFLRLVGGSRGPTGISSGWNQQVRVGAGGRGVAGGFTLLLPWSESYPDLIPVLPTHTVHTYAQPSKEAAQGSGSGELESQAKS